MALPHRLLLVEDDDTLRTLMERTLGDYGYSVHATVSGRDALDLLKTNSYTLVLLDLYLPDLNGLEILKEMRRNSITTPVIVVTGFVESDLAQECRAHGAYDVLGKPVPPVTLASIISSIPRN